MLALAMTALLDAPESRACLRPQLDLEKVLAPLMDGLSASTGSTGAAAAAGGAPAAAASGTGAAAFASDAQLAARYVAVCEMCDPAHARPIAAKFDTSAVRWVATLCAPHIPVPKHWQRCSSRGRGFCTCARTISKTFGGSCER